MITPSSWHSRLLGLLLFAYPLLLPLSVNWSDQPILLLSLLGLYALWTDRKQTRSPAPVSDRAALGGLGLLAVAGLASLANAHASLRQMVPYLCPLLALLLFPLARHRRLSGKVGWWALVAGLALAAAVSLWQVLHEGLPRARGYHFPNTYGALALLMTALLTAAWPYLGAKGWQRLALAFGMIAGLITIVLSGSRSAWLVLLALGLWLFGRRSRGAMLACLLATGLLLLLSWLVPDLAARWQLALSDLQLYDQGNADTSIGLRFVMWHAAWDAFLAHPILGLGADGFAGWLTQVVEQGRGPATLLQHNHAHNEVLHALATGGLFGLAGLLAAFGLPWLALRRYAREGDARQIAAARAGQVLILGTILLGLTDTLFAHRFLLTWYAVCTVLLLGWAGRPRS